MTKEFGVMLLLFVVAVCFMLCGCSTLDKVISDFNTGSSDVALVNGATSLSSCFSSFMSLMFPQFTNVFNIIGTFLGGVLVYFAGNIAGKRKRR